MHIRGCVFVRLVEDVRTPYPFVHERISISIIIIIYLSHTERHLREILLSTPCIHIFAGIQAHGECIIFEISAMFLLCLAWDKCLEAGSIHNRPIQHMRASRAWAPAVRAAIVLSCYI